MRPFPTFLGRLVCKLSGSIALISFCFLGACKFDSGDEGRSPEEMLVSYQAKIPVGTSLRAARSMMEADGFTVAEVNAQAWKGKKGFTYLRCTRDEGIVIKRRWEFAVMHNGQFVTSIEIRPGLVYP